MGLSRFGFFGDYILLGLVKLSFWCFLCFGITFVDFLNGESRPANIITCAHLLDTGWFHSVSADSVHPIDALGNGSYLIYVVVLLCGGVMC